MRYVVHCFTCDRDLVTVPTVARAERVLWDHIDARGHDVVWTSDDLSLSDDAPMSSRAVS